MAILKPVARFDRVYDITPEYLRSIGVKGIALDVDNTLSEHHSQTPLEQAPAWIRQMQDHGFAILIVSNAKRARVAPFADKLGLEFTSLALKPLPFGFWRAKRQMGIRVRELACIGDQLFTDMMGANLAGAKGLLVTPILEETGKSFRIRRHLERRYWKRRGEKQ